MPLAALASNNIYPKGALVLQMLKQYLGEQRFWASVNRYLVDHALDNATTDDLRQAVLDATGENLDWFWDQWIYQAGYPEFSVAARYDSSTSTVTLVAQQVQQDSSKADSSGVRYTTPAVFRMPVTIRVGTAAGAALATAAPGAEYFAVRASAIGALATFPQAVALAPLEAATTDTSAQVRAAAIEALGGLGGSQAAALARRAWTSDSSDVVRAAAVTAMALTDTANRRAIVLQALARPAYRDAIQIAAYRMIAASGDTALIDSVEAR